VHHTHPLNGRRPIGAENLLLHSAVDKSFFASYGTIGQCTFNPGTIPRGPNAVRTKNLGFQSSNSSSFFPTISAIDTDGRFNFASTGRGGIGRDGREMKSSWSTLNSGQKYGRR
jgi:hypothetical protein